MEMKNTRPVTIAGTGSYVPERVVSNYDLSQMFSVSEDWIYERTGINERRICDCFTATSDLAIKAANHALEVAGMTPGELDLIIVATATPDMLIPSTACIVQATLGADKAAAFDLAASCAGFVYGFAIGAQCITGGWYDSVLVIGADTFSKIVNRNDRNTCILFGDGAGAVLLKATSDPRASVYNILKAEGNGAGLLQVPAGGSRLPPSCQTISQGLHYLRMSGLEVFRFGVKVLAENVVLALQQGGFSLEEIDLFIPHQANGRLIETAIRKIGIPKEKVYLNIARYGNTSAASIPIALDEVVRGGGIKAGNKVVLIGFGAGLTWGMNIISWYPE